MASQRVSVEIWQKILRYAISCPVFFEKDPIEAWGYQEFINWFYEHNVYWAAERDRNALRRVCYAWNDYLIQFNHRYIDLEDVQRGHVPVSAISRAIRLTYVPGEYDTDDQMRLLEHCIREETALWSLEILGGGTFQIDNFLIKSERIPHIGSIICSEENLLPSITLAVRNLRFFDGGREIHLDPTDTRSLNLDGSRHVEFSHLTSLSIYVKNMINLLDHSFPALKHLSLWSPDESPTTAEQLATILKSFGRNLVTLRDNLAITDSFVPGELSTLCPKLKWLSTSLAWPRDVQVPWSLDTLQVPMDVFDDSSYPYERQLPRSFLQKAGRGVVALNENWMELFETNSASMIQLVLYSMSYDRPVVDIMGISFQDLVVGLLRNRRAGNCWDAFNWNQIARTF